jgi:DNA-binding protein HU-beta
VSLEARRKNKAAASSNEKKPKSKSNRVSGPLRSVAIGRAYREHEAPVDNEGRPFFRSIFDAQGHGAKQIGKDIDKERVLPTSAFFKHTNETVAKQVFGMAIRPKLWRMIVEGICDQALTLAEGGYKVKMPNLVVVQAVEREARKARNPRTGEPVDVPARTALSTKPTRSAKAYMANGGA